MTSNLKREFCDIQLMQFVSRIMAKRECDLTVVIENVMHFLLIICSISCGKYGEPQAIYASRNDYSMVIAMDLSQSKLHFN